MASEFEHRPFFSAVDRGVADRGLADVEPSKKTPRLAAGPEGLEKEAVLSRLEKLAQKNRSLTPGKLLYEIDHFRPRRPRAGFTAGSATRSSNVGFLLRVDNASKSNRSWPGSSENLEAFRDRRRKVSLRAVADNPAARRRVVGEMLGTRTFSEIEELDVLWKHANAGPSGPSSYETTRKKFMRLIAEDSGREAKAVREALELAGVELRRTGPLGLSGSYRMALPAEAYLRPRFRPQALRGFVHLSVLTRALGAAFFVLNVYDAYVLMVGFVQYLVDNFEELNRIRRNVDRKLYAWVEHRYAPLKHVENSDIFVHPRTGAVWFLDVAARHRDAVVPLGYMRPSRWGGFIDFDVNLHIHPVGDRWRLKPAYDDAEENQDEGSFFGLFD